MTPAAAEDGPRLRVGLVVPRLDGGGAEYVAGEWAAYLRSLGHEVTLITTHDWDGPALRSGVHRLESRSFPARVRELRSHLALHAYDVVVGLMPHWNVLVLSASLGAGRRKPATVITGHTMEHAARRLPGRRRPAESVLARALYRRADAYIGVSHPVVAEAGTRYGLDPRRLWVVANPALGKRPRTSLDRGHDHDGQRSVTLTVPGRLVAQKYPERAVEAAALLGSVHQTPSRVEYFGTGPAEPAVRAAADRLGVEVVFHGWVTAWFDHAARDAVVLLPSLAEGFGNVLVEAAAAGIPSVATSRALGVADAVVPNVTGVLAMTSEPGDLAEAVVRAMRLTPVSAPDWLRRFSPEESGEQLLRVLLTVTGAAARAGDGP